MNQLERDEATGGLRDGGGDPHDLEEPPREAPHRKLTTELFNYYYQYTTTLLLLLYYNY